MTTTALQNLGNALASPPHCFVWPAPIKGWWVVMKTEDRTALAHCFFRADALAISKRQNERAVKARRDNHVR